MATRTNPLQFIQQVRAEITKIIWPTRREVLLTTAMVFVMVFARATPAHWIGLAPVSGFIKSRSGFINHQ